MTLAIVDIDHFKRINDTFWYNAGDDVLCHFAHELTVNMRKENLICRWGGEKFVILIPEAISDLIFEHMQELREKISPGQKAIFLCCRLASRFTCSEE